MSKIIIKIKQIAQKLDKSITDIALETGLNRNTITALYHGKVDGIKFETITKFCDVYKLKLEDILELVEESPIAHNSTNVYKQEGEVIPFTSWAFGIQVADLKKNFFKNDYGTAYGYWRGAYMEAFWSIDNVNMLAAEVYDKYHRPQDMEYFYGEYLKTAAVLEEYYFASDEQSFNLQTEKQVLDFYAKLRNAYADFWSMALFIDAFDSGFDHKKINEIAARYSFSLDEVGLLTTPFEMTFNNERQLELFELVAAYKKQKKYKKVADFVDKNTDAVAYRKKFGYYKSNYCYVKSISPEEQAADIANWVKNEAEFKKQYKDLKNYSKNREEKISALLKKKKLKENPLYFFQKLAFLRCSRQKVSFWK
ncbi:helix-turn-helix transcriptional regulator, partial [Candidatus Falkowbacteria bacterium]|nr:helix-turn-helix transcriptional regulator [Candidatus Falkowbacteria bacterium]